MTRGIVFDIQPYAVHDGPGIRTLVFLKGCPLRCAWCCNPESQAYHPELRHLEVRCTGCMGCRSACAQGAVKDGVPGEDGTIRPVFGRLSCRDCEDWGCLAACPQAALVKAGREMDARDVVDQVARDADFYRNSGGGITFSGGEPFAQPDFLLAMLRLCRERGLSTAVETCGHVLPRLLAEAEPLVDHFLYDLKVMDPVRHARLTGQGNDLILGNLKRLGRTCPGKVTVRHPIIPGMNDDEANHQALAEFMAECGLRRLDVEPYHGMGEGKYRETGRSRAQLEGPEPLSEERIQAIVDAFREQGLDCGLA